jgi:hypothetical protein
MVVGYDADPERDNDPCSHLVSFLCSERALGLV